jgi:hypothetical protein
MYTLSEAAALAGQLGPIIVSAPWLKYLMTHVYLSLSAALDICKVLKHTKTVPPGKEGVKVRAFYQTETAQGVHKTKYKFSINKTLHIKLHLI